MAGEKSVKLHNKSDKPDNIVLKEHEIVSKCEEIQDQLPGCFKGFFRYLKGNVLSKTRVAYLGDILHFCQYLIEETDLTEAEKPADIKEEDFNKIKAADVNEFLDHCRKYKVMQNGQEVLFQNGNRTLARKKSSLSVLFKELYREGRMEENITEGFDPIRVPKASEREIKALQDDEVMIMLDAVESGDHLTPKERQYWNKTKKRDKAILLLFLTYGLRLFELQQLNVTSFNFSRGEFKIYRKRDKETIMPLNRSVTETLTDYIENERRPDEELDELHKDALFLSLQGKRMTERQIRELVKKYTSIGLSTSRKAGYSPHKLRATAATSLIGRGNSIYDVQALMDHEQVTTTQLYAAHKMNVKRDLVRDMEWELERKEGTERNETE